MAQHADKEPSMEEILASIRRIISEEGEPPAEPAATPVRAPEPYVEIDDPVSSDVLELTDPLPDAVPAPALVSEETAAVASQSLSALSSLMVRNYQGSDNTLEGLIREMLKPMLREWLDANLPEIVEKMVSREISRITGRGE